MGKGKWRGQGRGEFLPQGSYKLAGEYIHKKMFSNDSGGIWLKVRMSWQIVGSVGHGLSNQNPMGDLWKRIPESYLENFWFCRSKVGPDNLDSNTFPLTLMLLIWRIQLQTAALGSQDGEVMAVDWDIASCYLLLAASYSRFSFRAPFYKDSL